MMRSIFPYIRVMVDPSIEVTPRPVIVELDGIPPTYATDAQRVGYLHSTLPTPWLLPAIKAALADVGIAIEEYVERGNGWLAWADIDLSKPVPDLSAIDFGRYVEVRHV